MKQFNYKLRVGVFGHGKSNHLTKNIISWVNSFGECIASNNATLYTGGGGGIMFAVREGCIKNGGDVVSVNPEIELTKEDIELGLLGHVLASGQGKLGRVHILIQSIDIGFALGGGAGTLLEIITCYLLAKPVLVVDGFQKNSDPQLFDILNNIEEQEICGQKVWLGKFDGKDSNIVFPVYLCDKSLKPEDVFDIGKYLLDLSLNKKHEMK